MAWCDVQSDLQNGLTHLFVIAKLNEVPMQRKCCPGAASAGARSDQQCEIGTLGLRIDMIRVC